jgi:hypothetical protein
MAAPLGSGDGSRVHRFRVLRLRSGFTTLPSTDTEQEGAAFCMVIGLFLAYAPATLTATTPPASRHTFGSAFPQP